MSQSESAFVVPEGTDFLAFVWELEDQCEIETDKRFSSIGKKLPACMKEVGTVLSLLDRMASCSWQCRGGDHLIEYVCGRVSCNARAALRLMRLGFYDESLSLSRNIGEAANLLFLFHSDCEKLVRWQTLSRDERLREYSPLKVRLSLEDLNLIVPIDEERYRLLSERSTHINPHTIPQAHNALSFPILDSSFQAEGLMLCVNEISYALSISTFYGCLLLELNRETTLKILKSCRSLLVEVGGFDITKIDAHYQQF